MLVDACSIINLTNVGALEAVLQLARCRLQVPPMVLAECNLDAAAQVAAAVAAGTMDLVDDDDVPAEEYLDLLGQHGLGEGETECIAIAKHFPFSVCCDDRRARRIAGVEIGEARVVGTLRLLRWCVEDGILSCDDAYDFYVQMRDAGAFLPDMDHEFFCDLDCG